MSDETGKQDPLFQRRMRALRDRLMGIRPGFADERRVIDVARDSETRSIINWVLPGLCVLLFLILLIWHKLAYRPTPGAGMPMMMLRIFIFDYLIFLLGGLSGWNMARRWRGSASTVEELSLTSLNPAVIGHLFMAGLLSVWIWLMVVLLAVDMFMPVIFVKEVAEGGATTSVFILPFVILVPIILTWFHYESVHLAHWMFAVHSLPRISLLNAAVSNFVLTVLIVALLSGAGSFITMFCAIFVGLLLSATSMNSGSADFWIGSYTAWAIGCIPGAILVAWLKRQIGRSYETRFMKSWLLFQWWGAGESRQPARYPASYMMHTGYWIAYYRMFEEENADMPGRRRVWTRRYYQIKEALERRSLAQRKPVAGATTSEPRNLPRYDPVPLKDWPMVDTTDAQRTTSDNRRETQSQWPDPRSGP
ncbi:hypothetical protein KQI84_02130 [bacterium]|nr:hypothetical protein [bacterium]